MADKKQEAQAYALKVWDGQSPDLPRHERISRVRLALVGQCMSAAAIDLPLTRKDKTDVLVRQRAAGVSLQELAKLPQDEVDAFGVGLNAYRMTLDGLEEWELEEAFAEAWGGLTEAERRAQMGILNAPPATNAPKPLRYLSGSADAAAFLRKRCDEAAERFKPCPPEWEKWRLLPNVRVWEAVCLSFNIEPDDKKHAITSWLKTKGSYIVPPGLPPEYATRLRIVCANIGPKSRIKNDSSCGYLENPRQEISLPEFAVFAWEAWGHAIPEELKALQPAEVIQRRCMEVGELAEELANGRPINWDHWVKTRPRLAADDAARLMCGLDPGVYLDLNQHPEEVRGYDSTKLRRRALDMRKKARDWSMESASPAEWAEWGQEHYPGWIHAPFLHVVSQCATPGSVDRQEPEDAEQIEDAGATREKAWWEIKYDIQKLAAQYADAIVKAGEKPTQERVAEKIRQHIGAQEGESRRTVNAGQSKRLPSAATICKWGLGGWRYR